MRKFGDMKVGIRLAFGFALVLLLLIVQTVLGVARLAQMQEHVENITQVNTVKANFARTMRDTVSARMISLRDMALLRSLSAIRDEQVRLSNQATLYATTEARLSKMLKEKAASPRERELLNVIGQLSAAALPVIDEAASDAERGQSELVYEIFVNELLPLQGKWMNALDELIALEEKLNLAATHDVTDAYKRSRLLILALGGVAVLMGVAAAFIITRGLLSQLGGEPSYALNIAARIAAGDLSGEISVSANDRTSLMFAMKTMRDNLTTIVAKVRVGTDAIASASSQMASGNQDLSMRTEEQTISLDRTATSMEQLTSTVKHNADSAHHADKLAESSAKVAIEGGKIVSAVVATMNSIHASSRQISDITGVIDGISFQTNILALNAAVEAARAGEQGRGFAVVASEVRTLAQRSATAAREINALIADSLSKVEQGSRLVSDAGATMDQIVDSAKRVSSIISEIAFAGVQQTEGISHVNEALAQMDGMTQQNAALVEEAAAAANSMKHQALELSSVVGTFKLHEIDAG